MRTFADRIDAPFKRNESWMCAALFLLALAVCLGWSALPAIAQTGGEGAITGTVTDSTGAVVAGASVTATNVDTAQTTTRPTTSAGSYEIAPLLPGTYTLTVTAKGFEVFKQENMEIDAMHISGLNVVLKPGSESVTVTVTAAPPALETTNPVIGATMQTDFYTELPVMMDGSAAGNNQQRDITQLSNLLPGAQVNPAGRSSIVGGTASRLAELYVDGLPLTTASQQGDNRPVFNIVPLEGIDQVQVVTSGFSAEYAGAGLENYVLKSGSNQLHGALFEYNRNTAFDAWTFSAKPGAPGNVVKKVVNGVVTSVPGPKSPERQNEFGFKVGGPITLPHIVNGHDKLFFFATYDRDESYAGVNPAVTTVPTSLMQQGNFQELLSVANGGLGNTAGINYPIYDPTTQAACTKNNSTGTACRYQYGYGPGAGKGPNGNPVKTGAPINVIPASELSPQALYMESFPGLTPTVNTTGVITNNWIGGIPSGYHNWMYAGRIDYIISSKQTLSMAVTGGNRIAIPYTGTTNILPVPYLNDTASTVAGHWADLEHTYTITPHLVNQFKYGFANFGGPPVSNLTSGNSKYGAAAIGIAGLPAGQASMNFPISTFGGNANNPVQWSGGTTGTSVSNTFDLVDNLQWVKGKHAITVGIVYQWLQDQTDSADGPSLPVTLAWNSNETADQTAAGTAFTANTGYAFASYMIGAVSSSSVTQQPFSVVGGRYRPFAPYFQDDYKVTPNLTLNLGLRWDDIPTYREAHDRWSFLNPDASNPITGNPGVLQFAGNFGGPGVSIGGHTPVNTFYKNFGPRLGFEYAWRNKTVLRGGYALTYSHAGGTGGAGGAGTGTGSAGFNSAASFADSVNGPAFYLNSNSSFPAPNNNFGGPGYSLPAIAPITAISQTLGTGYYVCSGQTYTPCLGNTGGSSGNGTGIAFPDPYLGGRAPEFDFWNLGIQRELTRNMTVNLDYVGTESHFIAGASNIRGLQSGEIDPKWLALGATGTNFLAEKATQADITAAQKATGLVLPIPYAGYIAAAGVNANATIQHMLTWMPQYSGTTDTWGNVANSSYHAFELSLNQRLTEGLTFTVNYTYSKNLDDAGTQRSGYALPASVTATGHAWPANKIDRSWSTNSVPQNLTAFGVYKLPFGKGGIGSDSFLVRAIAGGWKFSSIFQYSSGLPLALTASCAATVSIGQGTCMPDANPNYSASANPVRINGGWGKGVLSTTLATKQYIGGGLSSTAAGTGLGGGACASTTGPFCNAGNYMIGDLARTAAYGLRGPSQYRLTSALRRTFDITERTKFVFGVDCQNVTNTVTFGNNAENNQIGVSASNASTLGTLNFASSDSRAFQFSGRLEF
jgi:hypothetical protein